MAATETPPIRAAVCVGVGAAVGAIARWQVAEALAGGSTDLPWETLIVNLIGCLAIGIAAMRIRPGSATWLIVVTGLLGGFTTFSAFANETRELLDADRFGLALGYVTVTLAGGLGAVAMGRRAGA